MKQWILFFRANSICIWFYINAIDSIIWNEKIHQVAVVLELI